MSEDAIDESQVDLSRPFAILGQLRAGVRKAILSYPDGTTGISANVVLHKTGDDALKAALEIAKSGNWPPPAARPKLNLPPARFLEKTYADQPYPVAEYRMLGAARIWGVFQYFHPYRHLYGEDWDSVLTEFLPKMAHAQNARDYHLAVAEMVAHVHDTHCFMNSSELMLFYGAAAPPVELRWIACLGSERGCSSWRHPHEDRWRAVPETVGRTVEAHFGVHHAIHDETGDELAAAGTQRLRGPIDDTERG